MRAALGFVFDPPAPPAPTVIPSRKPITPLGGGCRIRVWFLLITFGSEDLQIYGGDGVGGWKVAEMKPECGAHCPVSLNGISDPNISILAGQPVCDGRPETSSSASVVGKHGGHFGSACFFCF